MKRIIVPIDFSTISIKGLELAILFAGQLEAKIELVHVTGLDEKSSSEGERKVYLEEIRNSFDALLTEHKKLHPGIDFEYFIREGKIHNEIISQAESYKDSLIVTSTHGASGWEELFVGSNAYKITASSTKPVITIRGDNVPAKINKIILPIDSTLETREKVPFTCQLAGWFGASVHVVTVSTSDIKEIRAKLSAYAKQVVGYFKYGGINAKTDHLHGSNIADMVIEYAKNENADLISVMTEQEKSLSNILLGSYAHQMINKSPIPILLFPTKQIGIITEIFKTEGINY